MPFRVPSAPPLFVFCLNPNNLNAPLKSRIGAPKQNGNDVALLFPWKHINYPSFLFHTFTTTPSFLPMETTQLEYNSKKTNPTSPTHLKLFGFSVNHEDIIMEEDEVAHDDVADSTKATSSTSPSSPSDSPDSSVAGAGPHSSTDWKYECQYCCLEFTNSQALGGHQNAQQGASAAEACTITGLPKRCRFIRSEPDDLCLRPSAAPSGSSGDRGGPGGTSLVEIGCIKRFFGFSQIFHVMLKVLTMMKSCEPLTAEKSPSPSRHDPGVFFFLGGIVVLIILLILGFMWRRIKRPAKVMENTALTSQQHGKYIEPSEVMKMIVPNIRQPGPISYFDLRTLRRATKNFHP